MNLIQKIAIGYLLFCAVLTYGIMIGHYQWFPFGMAKEIKAFINYAGGTVFEKLESDRGGTPHRFLFEYRPKTDTNLVELNIAGLKARRALPRLYLSPDAPKGDRILFGAFDFEDTFWGAVLLDSDGRLKHTWRLSTEELLLNSEPDYRKNMYGVDVLPDGSVIFLMQENGGGIVKVDYCSNTVWKLDGVFHHTVTPSGKANFWTFEGQQDAFDHILALIDSNDGTVLKRINMKDVRAANPHKHIFDLQVKQNTSDAVHGNDIDPLPAQLVSAFPQFALGDMLVSFRTTNLVFVLDPNTLKIKWWRIGPWDRQHDPDWNKGGFISVFSNNLRGVGDYSNIIAIDPETLQSKILVAGSMYNFYSSINGMHEITRSGTILVTSTTQGRAFEVNSDGNIVFEFINRYDSDKTLNLSNARYLGSNYFQFSEPPRCKDQ